MKIGLLPIDSKFPNLALMKLSTYHKQRGDQVELFDRMTFRPDTVYTSLIFTWNKDRLGIKTLYPDVDFKIGGSGFSFDWLPDEVEHLKPDYSLYPIDFSMGFTSRGCLRRCPFCIVPNKEGFIRDHSPLSEFLNESFNKVMLLDNNLLAAPNYKQTLNTLREKGLKVDFNQGLDIRLITDENAGLLADLKYYGYPNWSRRTLRFAFDNIKDKPIVERGIQTLLNAGIKANNLFFYILVGFNTSINEDVERVEFLKEYGAIPFIMKYNRKSTPELNKLARWVNHIPYYQILKFEEFDSKLCG